MQAVETAEALSISISHVTGLEYTSHRLGKDGPRQDFYFSKPELVFEAVGLQKCFVVLLCKSEKLHRIYQGTGEGGLLFCGRFLVEFGLTALGD